MLFRSLKYLVVYITPAVIGFSLYTGGIWSYTALAFNFVLIPLLELFTKGTPANIDAVQEELMKKDRVYDVILYGVVPVQYAILLYFLIRISDTQLLVYEKIGMTTAFGLSCGILGINAAHELGHRSKRYEQIMSKMLLLTTLYMHFFIEHNRGHHKHVSTPQDPASARYGESVYAFYVRSVRDSWRSAWKIEARRLQKLQQPFWGWHNEMIWFAGWQTALLLLIAGVFGLATLLFFVTGAMMGCLLLETVNYIEHYGLQRKKQNDVYQRTMPVHSWNANHPIGRLLLFELTRHSDHHFLASRKYQTLRHFDESPQMPTGYPGMLLLSLVPPLWFYVMHRRIRRFKESHSGLELA